MPRFRPHRMYPGALLAQEACSYQASTELLAQVRGDLVVLVHSDRDCANVLPKTGQRIHAEHPYKFLCTNMKEDELVTGQGNAKLRRAIELVHAAWKPQLLVVLSTCPTVMIGDNVKNVVRKAARDLDFRVVSEVTHGLKPQSPAEVVDTVYKLLTAASVRTLEDVSRRVNLVGLSLDAGEKTEIEAGLAALGLTLNATLHHRSTLGDFLRMADAAFNIHPGPNLLLGLQKQALEQFGIASIEVPLPCGVQATDAFWQAIAEKTQVPAETAQTPDRMPNAATAPRRERAVAVLDAFRLKHAGRTLRAGYNIGSVRSFDLRRIGLEELGELSLLRELGFASKLYIQGPQHAENQGRTAQVLQELGVTEPFVLFPAPSSLVQFLEQAPADLFCGESFLHDQLTQVNLPLLLHSELGLGYDRVARDVGLIEQTLHADFYRNFRSRRITPDDADAAAA